MSDLRKDIDAGDKADIQEIVRVWKDGIISTLHELATCKVERDQYLAGLKRLQWSDMARMDEMGNGSCPECFRYPYYKHKPDCWLGKLLEGK